MQMTYVLYNSSTCCTPSQHHFTNCTFLSILVCSLYGTVLLSSHWLTHSSFTVQSIMYWVFTFYAPAAANLGEWSARRSCLLWLNLSVHLKLCPTIAIQQLLIQSSKLVLMCTVTYSAGSVSTWSAVRPELIYNRYCCHWMQWDTYSSWTRAPWCAYSGCKWSWMLRDPWIKRSSGPSPNF